VTLGVISAQYELIRRREKTISLMVGAFAEFQRAMLRERTKARLLSARREGRIGGRRPKLTLAQQKERKRHTIHTYSSAGLFDALSGSLETKKSLGGSDEAVKRSSGWWLNSKRAEPDRPNSAAPMVWRSAPAAPPQKATGERGSKGSTRAQANGEQSVGCGGVGQEGPGWESSARVCLKNTARKRRSLCHSRWERCPGVRRGVIVSSFSTWNLLQTPFPCAGHGDQVANRVDKHQSEAKLNPYGIEENLSSFIRCRRDACE
jgi:hypothetical protein